MMDRYGEVESIKTGKMVKYKKSPYWIFPVAAFICLFSSFGFFIFGYLISYDYMQKYNAKNK